MFTFRAQFGLRPEAEGRHSVAFWPASCTQNCLQAFAGGYAIHDAGAPELPALRTYRCRR
jgi:hypothetical protein